MEGVVGPVTPEYIMDQIRHLEHVIDLLEKSNEEMYSYDPNDADFIQAIKENKESIEKHKDKIIDLMSMLPRDYTIPAREQQSSS